MVLAGRVESGKVCVGENAILRTPDTSVPTVVIGVERDREFVSCASSGENVALMFREVDPSGLQGGLERVQIGPNQQAWRVLTLEVVNAPRRRWEFWK
jgi:translation elongation factor EF-Tu-like GTPase